MLKVQSYRAILSLNIVKSNYQTSYIISNETETVENVSDIYIEKYLEKELNIDGDNIPEGFKDIISSVESGDIIKILMSRNRKSIQKELSTYIKNLEVTISLIQRYPKIKSLCSKNHGLKLLMESPDQFKDAICDKCKQKIPKGIQIMHCHIC